MKILVLGGGNSGEREVSLRSAAAVAAAVHELGHELRVADPTGIRDWQEDLAWADLVFPILHGTGGEDGTIQKTIEAASKPYFGTGVAASELCFNKIRFKHLLIQNNVPTPKYELVNVPSFEASPLTRQPFVLKPIDGGSSIDTYIVRQPPGDTSAMINSIKKYGSMLLEELVSGIEITVGVLDETALPVIEIVPPEGGEFDYENKYNGDTSEFCPPKHVGAAVQTRAQKMAEQIHKLAGCRHLSRTDMIVLPNNTITVLETNTMPGLTGQSLFPKAAAAAGLDWNQLVAKFIELAGSKTPA